MSSFIYRYISGESCSQIDSLPLTYLTIADALSAQDAVHEAVLPYAREPGKLEALVNEYEALKAVECVPPSLLRPVAAHPCCLSPPARSSSFPGGPPSRVRGSALHGS